MNPDDIGRVATICTIAGTTVTGTISKGSKWLSSGEPTVVELSDHDHRRVVPLLIPWRSIEFVTFASPRRPHAETPGNPGFLTRTTQPC